MDNQITQLLEVLKAKEIRETEDEIYFKIGERCSEIYKGFPKVIQVETSSYCNLACIGCPQKDITRKKGFMKIELFKKLVDELSEYKVRVWLHYMGEPLMHPQIWELIDYAGSKLPYCGLATNGILLTKEVIEKIFESKLSRFEISIDSLNPEVSSQLRPGGNHKQILENTYEFFRIKYKKDKEYPITSINFRRLKENQDEIQDFIKHWKNILKKRDFVLSFPYEKFGGHESSEHATYTVTAKREACLKLWNKVNILSDGRLVPCDAMFDGQVVMGDTNITSINEIWNSDEYYHRRQKHLQGLWDELKICDVCDSWYREVGREDFKNLISETIKVDLWDKDK